MFEGLFQPLHLILILAIIMIVFGAGKLPEMGGAIGRGIKEFRNEVHDASQSDSVPTAPSSVKVTTEVKQPAVGTFCSNCGERVPNGAKFCPSCGNSVTVPQIETIEAIPVTAETVTPRPETPSA